MSLKAPSKNTKLALFMLPPLTGGGGAERFFIELGSNLSDRGLSVDVITMDEHFFRIFARLLHIVFSLNFFGKINLNGMESGVSVAKKLRKSRWLRVSYKNLKNVLGGYDLIYTKNEIVDLALLKSIGYRNLPPVVIGIHTPVSYPRIHSLASKLHNIIYASYFYRWLLQGTKAIHVSNRADLILFKQKYQSQTRFIPYPLTSSEPRISQKRSHYRVWNKLNVAFIGRLAEQKGVDLILQIPTKLGDIDNIENRISFNIFGWGGARVEKKLRNLSQRYSWFRFHGYVPNKSVMEILSTQDLMVSPSRWEVMPYSILEAQSMGVPVLALNVPGPSDIIISNRTGLTVDTEEQFFEQLKGYVLRPKRFNRRYIIQSTQRRFSPDRIYPQMISLFREFVNQ